VILVCGVAEVVSPIGGLAIEHGFVPRCPGNVC